jgi:hypothetical protein
MTPKYRMPEMLAGAAEVLLLLLLLLPLPPPPPMSLLPGRSHVLQVCCSFCRATHDHMPSAATRQAAFSMAPVLR